MILLTWFIAEAVARVDSDGETLFYASMSTSDTAFPTSALCVFSLSAIEQLFGYGSFLEQQQSGACSVCFSSGQLLDGEERGSNAQKSRILTDTDIYLLACESDHLY